jgi:hypothetical protein
MDVVVLCIPLELTASGPCFITVSSRHPINLKIHSEHLYLKNLINYLTSSKPPRTFERYQVRSGMFEAQSQSEPWAQSFHR